MKRAVVPSRRIVTSYREIAGFTPWGKRAVATGFNPVLMNWETITMRPGSSLKSIADRAVPA